MVMASNCVRRCPWAWGGEGGSAIVIWSRREEARVAAAGEKSLVRTFNQLTKMTNIGDYEDQRTSEIRIRAKQQYCDNDTMQLTDVGLSGLVEGLLAEGGGVGAC